MEVYLLRHGIAEEAKSGSADAERALTREGRQKLHQVLSSVRSAVTRPSLILTSPLVRAVQTAEMAAEVFAYQGELLETKALLPTASPQSVWQEVCTHQKKQKLLLVGHEPLLSQVVGYLLAAPRLRVDLKKAGLVRIDVETFFAVPSGTLKWFVTPKLSTSRLA